MLTFQWPSFFDVAKAAEGAKSIVRPDIICWALFNAVAIFREGAKIVYCFELPSNSHF